VSLRDVIKRHGQTYKLVSQGSGTYVQGRYVPAADKPSVSFIAAIQPVTGREIESLPEGQSTEDTRIVYTTYPLKTRNPAGAPDRVLYKSDVWRVYQVEEWEGLSGSPHYVARIVRQTSQDDPV
jgi:hypothetical protein